MQTISISELTAYVAERLSELRESRVNVDPFYTLDSEFDTAYAHNDGQMEEIGEFRDWLDRKIKSNEAQNGR